MSERTLAFITPSVAHWAIKRSAVPYEKLAARLNTSPEKVAAWERGEALPTFRQAQELARSLSIPFGYLFLPAPPEEKLPLPDFRTVGGSGFSGDATPDLIATLNDALLKQQWYREFLEQEKRAPLPFVGKFKPQDGIEGVAQDIRETLEINSETRTSATGWEDFLRILIRRAEYLGIVVMRSGVAAGNPHKQLSVKEFRGFAISDSLAPLIFINGADSKAAQVFTFAHEVAHLWIGATGVSNQPLKRSPSGDSPVVERFCNAVAAEALAPRDEFLRAWSKRNSIDENIESCVKKYRVSSLVILRRAHDLNRISDAEYISYYKREEKRFKDKADRQEPGGNFFATLFARNSGPLTAALVEAAMEGRVMYREAAALLNVKVPTIRKIAEHLVEAR